jgi:hypothetical protein
VSQKEIVMNRIRRFAGVLVGLAGTMLAFGAAAPAAFAREVPTPGGIGTGSAPPPVIHTVVVGGMPGWQIALIAAGAALAAATAAVLFVRARAGRLVTRAA